MKIDVTELRKGVGKSERHEFELELEPTAVSGQEVKFSRPLRVMVSLLNTGPSIVAQVAFDTSVEFACARCLRPGTVEIRGRFEEEFKPRQSGEERPGRSESVNYFDDNIIDLTESVTDNLYLSLPMRFICSEECKGLCPICGTNLNLRTCDCKGEAIDPRLAVLRKIVTGDGDLSGSSKEENV